MHGINWNMYQVLVQLFFLSYLKVYWILYSNIISLKYSNTHLEYYILEVFECLFQILLKSILPKPGVWTTMACVKAL